MVILLSLLNFIDSFKAGGVDLEEPEVAIKKNEKGKDILKNDKASLTGPHILDDLEKRIDNVEVVLNKPKKKKLKEKEVIILDSDTSTESLERSSFYDIPLSTHLFKTSSDNAFDLSSDDHRTVLKGKPGSRSKSVRVSKHSSSKEDKLRSNYKTLEADVGLPAVSLIVVVEAKNPPLVRN
ncbi:hypothetical protein Tco_0941682 [Tanacetum coccineum]|uniref:Uncharacterized protein n=1 Tax=Tanacetum coccineum TaxID=301880 RepID=A0ABQ5DRP4_9ASTR